MHYLVFTVCSSYSLLLTVGIICCGLVVEFCGVGVDILFCCRLQTGVYVVMKLQ